MAWPLECLREAERHPYGLADRLTGVSRSAPNSLVPSHVRSVSAPRFERGLVVDLYTLSCLTFEGLEQDSHRVSASGSQFEDG